jgi:hypothetical protein
MPRRFLSGLRERGPFTTIYTQEGENVAYCNYVNNNNICVDAAQAKLLRWLYTPPFDVWAEVLWHVGLTQKMDAAYHYTQLNALCTPAPVAAVGGLTGQGWDTHMGHSQVQTYGRHVLMKLYALAGGTQYAMQANFVTSGGTWQYYQAPTHLWVIGKAWPR